MPCILHFSLFILDLTVYNVDIQSSVVIFVGKRMSKQARLFSISDSRIVIHDTYMIAIDDT